MKSRVKDKDKNLKTVQYKTKPKTERGNWFLTVVYFRKKRQLTLGSIERVRYLNQRNNK